MKRPKCFGNPKRYRSECDECDWHTTCVTQDAKYCHECDGEGEGCPSCRGTGLEFEEGAVCPVECETCD